jgi:peptidoglycan LD-endopeptidase CwlK
MTELFYPDQIFFLSKESEEKLKGVHPDLAECVRHAIGMSDIQIEVNEGKRSTQMHSELFKKGATQNPASSTHFYGYAVDLYLKVDDRIIFEAEAYDDLAECMKYAAQRLNLKIRWGGAWHRDNFTDYVGFIEDLTNEYIDLRRDAGSRPILDLQHFELVVE